LALFLIPLVLGFVLRRVTVRGVAGGIFLSFSHRGSPIGQTLLLYFIHLLRGLITPLRLIIRFLLNLTLGCVVGLFLVSLGGLVLILFNFLGVILLVVYKLGVLLIQSFLLSFLLG
jgi:hypothetical protein